jgi:integrase
MRSVFVNKKEVRKSLGHRDKEKAIRQGYELLNALLRNEQALDEHSLTLGMLADLYLAGPAHHGKKVRTQQEEGRMLRRVVGFLGPTRNVGTLSDSDVRRYGLARAQGDGSLQRVTPGRSVRNRTIGADLEMLRRALNWAVRERTPNGLRLLAENPLAGVKVPREQNPRRPVMKHDVYLRLLKVADRVHPLLKLALVVAEGTGRRLSAWRTLRWDDVDCQSGTIRWGAETDKQGHEQVVPMSDAVRVALMAVRRAQPSIGNTLVFSAPGDPSKPCSRYLLDSWLRRVHGLAGVADRALWHALRRKWVTERKGYPVRDVMAAGGWKDEATMVTSYQQADAETVRQVVLNPTHRIVSQ